MPKNTRIPISKNIKKDSMKRGKSFLAQVAGKIRAELITKLPSINFTVKSNKLAMNVSTIHIKWDWSSAVDKKTITEVISKYGKKGGGGGEFAVVDYIFFDDTKSERFVQPNI